MNTNKSNVRRAATAVAVTAASVAGTLAFAPQAEAGWTHTHNFQYSYSILKDAPYVNSGMAIAYLYNDTGVTMLCWTDSQWVYDRNYSNYNSPRWFRVRTGSGKVGYVHSSYVYDQTVVGHC